MINPARDAAFDVIPLAISMAKQPCRQARLARSGHGGTDGHWPRHSRRPASSTTQTAVIFCETSKPTKWVIDQSPILRITGRRHPDRDTIGGSRADQDYRMSRHDNAKIRLHKLRLKLCDQRNPATIGPAMNPALQAALSELVLDLIAAIGAVEDRRAGEPVEGSAEFSSGAVGGSGMTTMLSGTAMSISPIPREMARCALSDLQPLSSQPINQRARIAPMSFRPMSAMATLRRRRAALFGYAPSRRLTVSRPTHCATPLAAWPANLAFRS